MSDSDQTLIVGLDGGGTGCRAAVGTSSVGILAQADGGRANFTTDPDAAIKNVIDTIGKAGSKAGIPTEQLSNATAHVGLAGVMTRENRLKVTAALPFKDVTVTDDRPTALNGALGGQDGFLLSVGTGTICAAQKDGHFRSVGGWGFHLADQASGAWLGRAALQQVLLCHDGIDPHSGLTHALFADFGNDPNAIVTFSLSAKPGDYAVFAPAIIAAAVEHDPWGEVIMRSGADHLEKSLAALGFQPGDAICLTGGVGPHYEHFLSPEVLTGKVPCAGSALDGAFRLAFVRTASLLEAPA